MIIIDTPFHVSFSSWSTEPEYACVGKCKKAWWPRDFTKPGEMGLCPMCGDALTHAVSGVHYKVIDKQDRNLTFSDIEKFEEPSSKGSRPSNLKELLQNGAKMGHSSMVKSKFIERAITKWQGHKNNFEITFNLKRLSNTGANISE